MPTITFIDPQGQRYDIEVKTGETLMMAALRRGVPGILAECGGACSCATCHVYVDHARVGPAGPIEKMILSGVSDLQPDSRLSCQIVAKDALDGLEVRIAPSQG